MKASTAILFSFLSVSSALASASEPSDEQLDDWMNYLRSVGIPSTVKICGAAIDDEARFKTAADAWSLANQASVERGRTLASAHPPKGWPSLDAYNENMVKDFEAKLTNMPAIDQLETCVEYVELLEKRAAGR
ncbi:hypothetical protein [Lysobacter sp. Root494]|jgi:hypothetical protein|uniref:hypothetical protein n=1 Tax=Lysobacter sp. Root494 TaxID=1736549 RepID=UPI0006F89246|nr:hypothetical protein [Lysobacter sp. Root494]KQY54400.1 hypothetical protein ASD14_15555 [Lysobacter sp. Root494]